MEDRKKRLEEIRRRKANLQKLVQAEATNPNPQPPAQPDPTKETPSQVTETSSSISESSTPSISTTSSFRNPTKKKTFMDDAKNQKLLEIHIKKINETLRTEKSEHFLQGIFPDIKDEITQYVLPEEYEKEKKEEEAKKQEEKMKKTANYARRASIGASKEVQKKMNLIQLGKQKIKEGMKKAKERNLFYKKNENQLKAYYDDHLNFFEEALGANDIYDICNSYYNEQETDVNISKKTLVTYLCDLYDEHCNGRIVTSLEWSPIQNDLFLSAFSGTEDFNQQSGLIELWSLTNRKNPDHVINYQTELTSAIFYKDNSKLIIGGSVTGQVMFWDIREKKVVPEQKSPLGIGTENNSHCYPIHCLSIVGKDNNLISISTDGVLCEWSLSNLSMPINRYVLNPNLMFDQDKDNLNEIGPICISASQAVDNSIILGCDENNIYNIKLEEKRYNLIDTFGGSKGPIFCVDNHPISPDGSKDFCDLFLSCGADWTTKLWSTSQPEEPLLTFTQSKDYVYSAKWHPINPSLFATADGSGYIDLWDLNRDKELPTFRYNLKKAINKLAWSSDGKKLAAGDINGHINIFSSEKDVLNVKIEDVNHFNYNIIEIKENCKYELEKRKKKDMK
jgi:dynein intermediate chain